MEHEKKASQPEAVEAKPLGTNEGNREVCVGKEAG